MIAPGLINFQKIGDASRGFLSVAENIKNIPFAIKRVYWVYDVPAVMEKGNHANRSAEHVLISLNGVISVELENVEGKKFHYELKDSSQGLYIPPLYWRKVVMNPEAICLSLSSAEFDENDYIRNYDEFLKMRL